MPHFYRSPDDFLAAAHAAVAGAAPRLPVGVLIAEVDPPRQEALPRAFAEPEQAIAATAEIVRHLLRADDLVGVMGARIVVVLAGCGADDCRAVGERLCASVRMHQFQPVRASLALSIGAASAPENGATYDALIAAASKALQRIQQFGRDGAAAAPPEHHEALSRPLSIDRFAGRRQLFSNLVGLLDRAAGGQPTLVSIFGASGTGTGMLVKQLEAEVRLRGGAFYMATANEAEIAAPFGIWRAVLRESERALAPAGDGEDFARLAAMLTFSEGELPATSHYRLQDELSAHLRALAAQRPVVLVLDDMQWADEVSWDALEHVLAQVEDERILVCLTMSAAGPDAAPAGYRGLASRYQVSDEIVLSGLTRDEVKQWLESALHGQAVGRELLAFLYRHTEGNPHAIAQVLRLLLEEGALWFNGSRWEWKPVSELRPPAGVLGIISQRLQRFSASTQAVLSTAAIIGREFDVALVVAAGAGSEPAVKLAFSEAHLAGFIHRTRDRRSQSYAFAHHEIERCLLGAIAASQMAQLHGRVAGALEARGHRDPGEIAFHYDRAGLHRKAYQFARQAARAAERIQVLGAAQAYLQMAVRNALEPEELADVRVEMAHLADTRGRYDEVEELCDLAIEWFTGRAEPAKALPLRRLRERARIELGQPTRVALDSLLALDEEAQRLGLDRERISVLTLASQTYGRLGDPRTAERIARECVSMSEAVGDPILLANSLLRLGVSIGSENPSLAQSYYGRALTLYEVEGDARGQARAYNNIGVAAQFEGRLTYAQEAYTKTIALARSEGLLDVWGLGAANLGVLAQKIGDYDKAREQFGEAIELFARMKNAELQVAALLNMAHVERELGAWDAAIDLYEATSPLAQRIGQSDIEVGALAGEGLCLLALDRTDDARRLYTELQERVASRSEWFQGRDLAEAFFLKWRLRNGAVAEALSGLSTALELAESGDVYTAAWLVATCASDIRQYDSEWASESVNRYAEHVESLGYPELTRRYAALRST